MFTYKNYGLGAAIETNKAKAVFQYLMGRQGLLKSSCYLPTPAMPTGSCAPGIDEKADYFVMEAVLPQGVEMQSVYEQLQSLVPGAKALVDTEMANKILMGDAVNLRYVIARNDAVCKYLSEGGGTFSELPSISTVVAPAEEKKGIKPSAVIGALVAAAAGALVAGPAGAVIGGGVVGYYLQTA